MDKNGYLKQYYGSYREDARLSAAKHGLVEYLTTMKYIHKFLEQGMRILEVGAGTGRYSLALAKEGFRVDAVELLEHNLNILRSKTEDSMRLQAVQGDALDLSAFEDHTYDMTLLLGPLYHLYSLEDKRRAVSEALRVTKKGGIIFAAHVISDGCLLDEGFNRGNISVKEYIEKGLLDGETFAEKSEPKDLFELVRKEDVDELMSVFPVKRLHYVIFYEDSVYGSFTLRIEASHVKIKSEMQRRERKC